MRPGRTPRTLAGQAEREVFLGRDYGHQANYSDEVATRIDTEIRALVEAAHAEAQAVLLAHRTTLDVLAAGLVDKETLGPEDLAELLGGLPAWTGVGGVAGTLAPAAMVAELVVEPDVEPAPVNRPRAVRKRATRAPKPATA